MIVFLGGFGMGVAFGMLAGLMLGIVLWRRGEAWSRELVAAAGRLVESSQAEAGKARDVMAKTLGRNERELQRVLETVSNAIEKSVRVVAYPQPPHMFAPLETENAELTRDTLADQERVPAWMEWQDLAGAEPDEAVR